MEWFEQVLRIVAVIAVWELIGRPLLFDSDVRLHAQRGPR